LKLRGDRRGGEQATWLAHIRADMGASRDSIIALQHASLMKEWAI
jgi:hypothetical protein